MASLKQRVKVLRGFRHAYTIQGPGTVLDLDKALALELRSANKVEFVDPETKLSHTAELPDPNKVLAERRANREAAAAQLKAAADQKATQKVAAVK